MMIGVFSKKAAKRFGTLYYTCENGIVEVTGVYESENQAREKYLYDDIEIIGPVFKYVREGQIGDISFVKNEYIPTFEKFYTDYINAKTEKITEKITMT